MLVPFAAAADDHQRKNADVMVEAGAAAMILERDLTVERALEVVGGLLEDHALRVRMGLAARRLAHEDAAGAIAVMCLGMVRR